MSDLDIAPTEVSGTAGALPGPQARLIAAREVPLGGIRAMTVTRTLPERALPTVGAWCFLDEAGPEAHLMRVLPHPHTGLQTVSWLLEGSIRHRDSVGSDVIVRPGELDLMTSGDGIAHSEFTPGELAEPAHLLQLWVALPESARRGPAHFEQHRDLPVATGAGWSATVLLGALAGVASPARTYSPLVGAEVRVEAGATAILPLRPDFEHAILAPLGSIEVEGIALARGPLLFLGGRRSELVVTAGAAGATLLLIGGEPLGEDLVMWWNFVGRTHEEIVEARADWESGSPRFGRVDGHGDDRIPAPPQPNVRLTPRRRPVD